MLRLVLGKLYDNAALLPGKLDERLRQIASVVSSGLAGASLAPAYAIPAARFREGRSQFVLQARFTNTEQPAGWNPCNAISPPVPVESRLDAVEFIGAGAPPPGIKIGTAFAGGFTAWLLDETSRRPALGLPAAAGETVFRWSYIVNPNPAQGTRVVAGGEFLWAQGGPATGDGLMVYRLSIPHSA